MKYAKSESLKQLPEALESNTGILMTGNFNIMIILRPPAHVDYLKMNVHFYWTPYYQANIVKFFHNDDI